MDRAVYQQMVTALRWYADNGLSECVQEDSVDRFQLAQPPSQYPVQYDGLQTGGSNEGFVHDRSFSSLSLSLRDSAKEQLFLGKADSYEEAVKLASGASTLEELKQAICGFDGISLRKTATSMVFSSGNPRAEVMLVGDAPGADDDRSGVPFVGVSGQLLDKILSCIGISRESDDPAKSIYISNILNWRPPGNRTPSPAEIELSLPFIERHIQLVRPKIIILCGGVAAKALLGSGESISRLRNRWHDYVPRTQGISGGADKIPAIAIYPPSSLLGTPLQKRQVWMDMLAISKYRGNL